MHPDGSTVLYRALPKTLLLANAEKRELKRFLRECSRCLSVPSPVTCLLTNDQELHRLNRTFLKHDYATDVLSFPASEQSSTTSELAISVERAFDQARALDHPLLDELKILMLHGLLHLAGLDHEVDKGEMAAAETQWRLQFALPTGLIERTQTGVGAKTAKAPA